MSQSDRVAVVGRGIYEYGSPYPGVCTFLGSRFPIVPPTLSLWNSRFHYRAERGISLWAEWVRIRGEWIDLIEPVNRDGKDRSAGGTNVRLSTTTQSDAKPERDSSLRSE